MRNKLRTWVYGAAGLVMAGGLLFTPIQGILPAAGDAPSAYVNAETLMGWHTFSDGKTYYYVDGQKKYGVYNYNGRLYFFDRTTGEQLTGWQENGDRKYYFQPSTTPENRYAVSVATVIDGGLYYFNPDCTLRTSEWIEIGSYKYYADKNGKRASGFTQIGKNWYYFDPAKGYMYTGTQKINGKSYTFSSAGVLLSGDPTDSGSAAFTGWKTVGAKKYYYEKGKKVTGWKTISGKRYHFASDGAMQKGWQKIGKNKFYLGTNGVMQKGWQKIGKKKYYFGSNGVMRKNWQKIGTKKYYFGSDGAMRKDWQKISKKKYYFGSDGVMRKGWQTISKKKYFFRSNGTMASGEYIKGCRINKDGTWTYKAKASWKKDKNGKYYSDAKGWRAKSRTLTIDGKKYTFNAKGYVK